jgi:hypothetical protein
LSRPPERLFYTGVAGFRNSSATTLKNSATSGSSVPPSARVERFLALLGPGGLVLDLAAGAGRHVRLLRDHSFAVRPVDRDI